MSNTDPPKGAKSDIRVTVVEVYDWLERGGDTPGILSSLGGRTYEDLLTRIKERIESRPKMLPSNLDPERLATILTLAKPSPNAKIAMECFTAALRLAIIADPTGASPAKVIEQALKTTAISAADADFLLQPVGTVLVHLANVASKWSGAPEGDWPTSVNTSSLARVISASFRIFRTRQPEVDDSTLRALAQISDALDSIRVVDLRGHQDPLLHDLAVSARSLIGRPAQNGDSQSGIVAPAQLVVPQAKSDVREVPRGDLLLKGLRDLLAELDAARVTIEKANSKVLSLHEDNDSLRARIDTLQFKNAELDSRACSISSELTVATREAQSAHAAEQAAIAETARWRRECNHAHFDAQAEIREKIGRAAQDVQRIVEKYGPPALVVAEMETPNPEDMRQLNVNLSNLISKVTAVTQRLQSTSNDQLNPTVSND
jgi:cell division septum initiation protein DivIVA